MADVERRCPIKTAEFLQAVREVARDVLPFIADKQAYRDAAILERLTKSDRSIQFRVAWVDDASRVHVNRGYRSSGTTRSGPTRADCASIRA